MENHLAWWMSSKGVALLPLHVLAPQAVVAQVET